MSWKKKRFENFRLYAITDLRTEEPEIFQKVTQAYRGGADIVQLRSKTLTDAALCRIGLGFRKIANQFRRLFFVNDRVDVALTVGADGVHLGQDDLPAGAVRKVLGGRPLFIGRSTHSLDEALRAEREGVDYIGVGPIFETPTKPTYKPVGLELIRKVKERVRIPFICIGGIDQENVHEVIQAGGLRVAVVRAIFGAEDVEQATKNLLNVIARSPAITEGATKQSQNAGQTSRTTRLLRPAKNLRASQ